jgi:hypothetical protein
MLKWRSIQTPLFVAMFWLVTLAARTVMAQEESGSSKEAWVVSYLIVVLAVGLGLFLVCRSSRRAKKAKKKQ